MKMKASANIRFKSAAARVQRKKRLLSILKDDPDVSRKTMLATLGVSDSALRIYMRELHREGRLPEGAHKRFKKQGYERQSSVKKRMRKQRLGWLLLMLEEHPGITTAEILRGLGITAPTLREYMRDLNSAGRLPEGAFERFKAQGRPRSKKKPKPRKKPKKPTRKLSPKNRKKRLLQLMRRDPSLSVKALAEGLGASTRSVERDRADLRRDGFITGTGRRLYVAANTFGAKRELDMRIILKLLKDDPTLTRGALANNIKVSKTHVTALIKTLKARGSLPRTFSLRRKQSYERMHQKMDARRAARRPTILAGVSENLTQREIAWMIGCNDMTISKDIKAMRYLKDPGLAEAERVRDALRGPSRPETTPSEDIHTAMVKAFSEIGLTLEEVEREHVEWMDSADPDTPLTRKTIA